ncbi:MAG: class II fructose-bisphosphatase [Candidatus Pelagibacterales bacterium]|jgi:fructose-1,6-bisphosphatase II / sedoheptulose-1,7-bisphosphatase|tara:strand:+ start:367 stop:1317 length:951 start_codon:yes stop_codon:yes gene_type:complete
MTIISTQYASGIVAATEKAAIASSMLIGLGDEKAADQKAVDAMRTALNQIDFKGRIVIGEGERDEAPMLYIGEEVGTGRNHEVDIALDPLEGTTITAKGMPNSLSVIAAAQRGGLLYAPDTYMNKIAVGGNLPDDIIDLDATTKENIQSIADAKKVPINEVTACVLERSRHDSIIEDLRSIGAKIVLIPDGDVAGIIMTTQEHSSVDIYMGVGGAPEGVLAAAALQCIGGQMQTRLVINNEDEKIRAEKIGIKDLNKKYSLDELAHGDIIFSATGVTEGTMVRGVRTNQNKYVTHSLVLRTGESSSQYIETYHDIS